DSKRLAVSSGRRNDKGEQETVLRFFDLASGAEQAQFPLGQGTYFSMIFSPDGKAVACGSSDRSCLVDCATGRVLHRFTGRPQYFAFTSDGKTMFASSGSRLRVWDVASGKELHDRPGDFRWTPAPAMHPDGRLLAVGDWVEQAVGLWDPATGRR